MELAGTCSEVCCYFSFFNSQTISELHSRAETNTAQQLPKLFSNFPYESYESAPLTEGKRMHVTFIQPTQCSILLGKSPSPGPMLFPLNFFSSKFAFCCCFYCKFPRKDPGLHKPTVCACLSQCSLFTYKLVWQRRWDAVLHFIVFFFHMYVYSRRCGFTAWDSMCLGESAEA